MSTPLSAITITSGQTITTQLELSVVALLVSNKSPFDLQVSGFGIEGAVWFYAGKETLLTTETGPAAGTIVFTAFNTTGIAPSSSGVILVQEYLNGDTLPDGTWPVSIPVQIVNTNVSASNTLSNETSAQGTIIIDMGFGTHTNLINIYNDGHCTWSVVQGTTAHTVFSINTSGNPIQIGESTDTSEVLGTLAVDGGLTTGGGVTSSGDITASGTNTIRDVNTITDSTNSSWAAISPGSSARIQNAVQVRLQIPGGTDQFTVSGTDTISNQQLSAPKFILTGSSGQYNGYVGSISRVSTGTYASNVGGHTVNHNLGAAPTNVITTGGSSTGTATTGSDTYGSTTFTATEGAGGVTMRFRAERA